MLYLFGALTRLSALAAIFLGKEIVEWKKYSLTKKIFFIISCLCVAGFCFITIKEKFEQKRKEEIASNITTISSDNVIYPVLRVKDSQVRLINEHGHIALQEYIKEADTSELLAVSVINNKMYAYFILKDSYGNVIFNLDRNEMKMYMPDKYDFNYDDKAIEVVTHDRKVVFQIEYLNNEAVFCGFVLMSDTTGYFAKAYYKNTDNIIPNGQAVFIKVGKGDDFTKYGDGIKRIFRYPKENHFKERDEQ